MSAKKDFISYTLTVVFWLLGCYMTKKTDKFKLILLRYEQREDGLRVPPVMRVAFIAYKIEQLLKQWHSLQAEAASLDTGSAAHLDVLGRATGIVDKIVDNCESLRPFWDRVRAQDTIEEDIQTIVLHVCQQLQGTKQGVALPPVLAALIQHIGINPAQIEQGPTTFLADKNRGSQPA